MILLLLTLLSLLDIGSGYGRYARVTATTHLCARTRTKSNDSNSNANSSDNSDKFINDLINLSDSTNLNKKVSRTYMNDDNLNAKQKKDIIDKNIEEVQRVASLLTSPSSSSSSRNEASSSKSLEPYYDSIYDTNDFTLSNSFDIEFDSSDDGFSLPSLPSALSSSLRKKKNANDLAIAFINDIEANKDSIEISNPQIDEVLVSPREKAREKLLKQLTEPLPEYDGPSCPRCSRPSTTDELASFKGKCSLCRQEELSEPDINLEYRYRLRDMKERRSAISSSSTSVARNVTVETHDDRQKMGKDVNNNNPSKSSRWPTVPEGVFDTPVPLLTRDKLSILSYDKRNDDENYDDSAYVDHYERMDSINKIRRNNIDDDIWERHCNLEAEVKSISDTVDKFSDVEKRLDNVINDFYKLENSFKQLELRYHLLQKKKRCRAKKENERK
jgi:hypothetical protein